MIELGETIKNKRIDKSLKITDVAKTLRISKRYLKAIEEGNIDIFSTESYYYGYLKQYLKYLGLEDIDTKSVSTAPDINVTEPVATNSNPSLILLIISVILSIIIYTICNSTIV